MSAAGGDAVVKLVLSFIDWMEGNSEDTRVVRYVDQWGHTTGASRDEIEALIRGWLAEEKEG